MLRRSPAAAIVDLPALASLAVHDAVHASRFVRTRDVGRTRRVATALSVAMLFAVSACGDQSAPSAPELGDSPPTENAVLLVQDGEPPKDCEECVMGPTTFERTGEEPQAFKVEFDADPEGAYELLAIGEGAGSVAWAWLNGVPVLQPFNLHQSPTVEIPVDLVDRNGLELRLAGVPGWKLRLLIRQIFELDSCGDEVTFFTQSTTDPSLVSSITPLGNTSPPSHTLPTHHLGMAPPLTVPTDPDSDPMEVDVVAPADMRVVAVERVNMPGGADFSLHLRPCREVRLYILHLNSLAPAISAVAGAIDDVSLGDIDAESVALDVSAGDLLGRAGRAGVRAYDVGLIDERQPELAFANRDRYLLPADILAMIPPEHRRLALTLAPQRLVQFCALDYFTPGVKATLEAKLGDLSGTPRTVPPVCGEHMQDVPGTAQGNWFTGPDENAFIEDRGTLALVHDHVDPTKPEISISQAVVPPGPVELGFTVAATGVVNRDFDDVVPGGLYCYEGLTARLAGPIAGRIVVQLTATASGDRLWFEYQPTAIDCTALPIFFGGGETEFQR